MISGIIPGDQTVEVNVRSFGVRMPPSTSFAPNYGVMGMVQFVPVSIAWLWRLISPRGFKNPSIADSNAGSGLKVKPWMKPLFRYFIPVVVIFIYVYGLVTFQWK